MPGVPREVGEMRIGSIVIRCYEWEKMFAFWSAALSYVPRDPPRDGWVVLKDPKGAGPNISLDRVPQPRQGKRSRLHLDLYTDNQEAEVERLIQLGARRYPWRYRAGADFVVTPTTTCSASSKRRAKRDLRMVHNPYLGWAPKEPSFCTHPRFPVRWLPPGRRPRRLA